MVLRTGARSDEADPACFCRSFRGPAGGGAHVGRIGDGQFVLRRVRRGNHPKRLAAGRRDLPHTVPGRPLERNALPLQPRLRNARIGEPGRGRRRSGHRRLVAQPRLRTGRLVLRHDRLGHSAGTARPDQHARRLRPDLRHAVADHRLGALAGRHHHRGPDPALPGPVHRRAAHVRRAVRWRRHLEHRAGLILRFPATARPVGPGRQHHRSHRQPGQRRGRGDRGPADPSGPGPAGPGRRAG